MKSVTIAALAISLLAGVPGHAQQAAPPPAIATAIASPDRPQADKDRDASRKPAELLAFAGIEPGESVADLLPGGGYFTRLFSMLVGPAGKVYAVVPPDLLARAPTAADAVKAIAAQPAFANVAPTVTPLDTLALPGPLDLVWTSDNYHDFFRAGEDAPGRFVAAAFKALKPGGLFIVVDHRALPGSGVAVTRTLHRIDPAIVKAQALAAGFVLEGESDALHNADDPHDVPVFDPSVRGRTDQFALRFRKPAS